MLLTDLQQSIRTLIAEDQLPAAIDMLLKNVRAGVHYDALILQSSKLNGIRKAVLEGRINYEEEQKQLNQLRTALVDLIGRLQEEDLQVPRLIQDPEMIYENYWQSLTRVTILWILVQEPHLEDGLTISELYTFSKVDKRKYIVQVLNELRDSTNIETYRKDKLLYWKLTSNGKVLAEELLESAVFDFLKKE